VFDHILKRCVRAVLTGSQSTRSIAISRSSLFDVNMQRRTARQSKATSLATIVDIAHEVAVRCIA
jgi:hypothetical protein